MMKTMRNLNPNFTFTFTYGPSPNEQHTEYNLYAKMISDFKKNYRRLLKEEPDFFLRFKNVIYLEYITYYINLRWMHHYNIFDRSMKYYYCPVLEIEELRVEFRVNVEKHLAVYRELAAKQATNRENLRGRVAIGDQKAIDQLDRERCLARERKRKSRENQKK
jgi:hypothetical protein